MRAALKKSRPLLEWGCRSTRWGRSKLFRRKFVQLGRPSLSPNRAIPNGVVITLPSVVLPLQRLEVRQFISSPFANGDGMIDFPSEYGLSISVFFPFCQSTARVPAILGWVRPSYDYTLIPNRNSGLESEVIAVSITASLSYCFHKSFSEFRVELWGFPQSYWNQGQSLGYCSASNCPTDAQRIRRPLDSSILS